MEVTGPEVVPIGEVVHYRVPLVANARRFPVRSSFSRCAHVVTLWTVVRMVRDLSIVQALENVDMLISNPYLRCCKWEKVADSANHR
jgi:hypothetical protein